MGKFFILFWKSIGIRKRWGRFTDFYVSSTACTPSRSALMTGCYAQRVQMHWNERDRHVLRPVSPYGLHPGELTIAEVLKTLLFPMNPVGKNIVAENPYFLRMAKASV